jgi:hypothetical protein
MKEKLAAEIDAAINAHFSAGGDVEVLCELLALALVGTRYILADRDIYKAVESVRDDVLKIADGKFST